MSQRDLLPHPGGTCFAKSGFLKYTTLLRGEPGSRHLGEETPAAEPGGNRAWLRLFRGPCPASAQRVGAWRAVWLGRVYTLGGGKREMRGGQDLVHAAVILSLSRSNFCD